MTFSEALRTSLRSIKEAYRMLDRLLDINAISLSSSEPILKKFMAKHEDKIICIFTDYKVTIRSDALVIALKSKQQFEKLIEKFKSYDVRFLEVDDFEELISWRDLME